MTENPVGGPEQELAKARRHVAAAELLARHGFVEDAVSRAYYAGFHAAAALLASIGRTARTHDGLRAVVAEHFIKTGRLDPRFGRVLSRSAADRNDADYSSAAVFRAEDADDAIRGAADLIAAVEALLAT